MFLRSGLAQTEQLKTGATYDLEILQQDGKKLRQNF